MTGLLREVVNHCEQLPDEEQNALAELPRRELDAREPERRRQAGLATLDRLAKLTADLPSVDAVRIARESRNDLDRRTFATGAEGV